jgi:hypothetical protein
MGHPNMSCCMCQNTLLALHHVLNAAAEGANFINELSPPERRAYEQLYDACREFIRRAAELQGEIETEGFEGC